MTWTLATYARRHARLRARAAALEREVRLLRTTVGILARETERLRSGGDEVPRHDDEPPDFSLSWPEYWDAHPEEAALCGLGAGACD